MRADQRFVSRLPESDLSAHVTSVRGLPSSIDGNGLPTGRLNEGTVRYLRAVHRPVLLLHGFFYDPLASGAWNPHQTVYQAMRSGLHSELDPVAFGWMSSRISAADIVRGWKAGHVSPYHVARAELALQTGALARVVSEFGDSYSVVAHSLGCELAFQTLARHPRLRPPQHVVLLNADVDREVFERYAVDQRIEVLSVDVARDTLLRFSHFARRNRTWQQHTTPLGPARWTDVCMDPAVLSNEPRLSIDYRSRRRLLDHMATVEFDDMWLLYNGFLLHGTEALRAHLPTPCARLFTRGDRAA